MISGSFLAGGIVLGGILLYERYVEGRKKDLNEVKEELKKDINHTNTQSIQDNIVLNNSIKAVHNDLRKL